MKNLQMTQSTKQADIKRTWHLIDLKDKVLGRQSSYIAQLLMGKGKNYFTRNMDVGDYVIVINAKQVKATGRKEEKKTYYRVSGFPGGMRKESLKDLRERRPEEVIYHAVRGMLPQNRLRDRMLRRLKIFAGDTHPYEEKLKVNTNDVK